MFGIRMVWLMVGLLCKREHLSPWRQALLQQATTDQGQQQQRQHQGELPALQCRCQGAKLLELSCKLERELHTRS